jgi:hypothetical protein
MDTNISESERELIQFLASDERMNPSIRVGDLVGGYRLPIEDFKQLDGEITAAVQMKSGNVTICRISPLTSTDATLLCCFTDTASPVAPVMVAMDNVSNIYRLTKITYRSLEL